MKKEISDLISKVRILDSLESSFHLLQLEHLSALMQSINKNMPRLISSMMQSQEAANPALLKLRESLQTVVAEVENAALPHKEELLDLLSSCLECFAEKNMADIFKILQQEQSEISQELSSLEDLCEAEF